MSDDPLSGVADIVSSYVLANKVDPSALPALIQSVYQALTSLGNASAVPVQAAPVVKATPSQVRRSIRPEGLVSFEDGKTYQTLKRHLTGRGLTLAEYRTKWGLPSDYPSTAPHYAARRSELAKAAGLGRKRAPMTAPVASVGKRQPRGGAVSPKEV